MGQAGVCVDRLQTYMLTKGRHFDYLLSLSEMWVAHDQTAVLHNLDAWNCC